MKHIHVIFLVSLSAVLCATKHDIVVLSQEDILNKTAQGKQLLTEIDAFENKIIHVLDQQKENVAASEKEYDDLQQEYKKNQEAAKKKSGGQDAAKLQQQHQALMVLKNNLQILQAQFFEHAEKARNIIDEHYRNSVQKFFQHILAKHAPVHQASVVLSSGDFTQLYYSHPARDITKILLEKMTKQSDLQNKKYSTVSEVEALFKNLDLQYLYHNQIPDAAAKQFKSVGLGMYQQYDAQGREHVKNYMQKIQTGVRAPMHVAWVSDKVGWGVFADKDIVEGQFIQEYTGVAVCVTTKDQFDATYAWCVHNQQDTAKFCVDSKYKGNEMRLVNHSNHPNVRCFIFADSDGNIHVGYFAKAFIKAGEQLLVSYGDEYWKNRHYYQELLA